MFDKDGQKLDDPILIEQVYGQFDDFRIYDVSFLQYKDNIYYFKRLHNVIVDNQGQNDQSLQISEFDEDKDGEIVDGLLPQQRNSTCLQLYKYNMQQGKETELKGYRIVEEQWQAGDDEVNKEARQFNVMFSKKFDDACMDKDFKDEDDFLSQQYFCIQQYVIKRQQKCPFRIIKLAKNPDSNGNLDLKKNRVYPSVVSNRSAFISQKE